MIQPHANLLHSHSARTAGQPPGLAKPNWLTNPAFDPISQTAEYKACAVTVEKIVDEAAA